MGCVPTGRAPAQAVSLPSVKSEAEVCTAWTFHKKEPFAPQPLSAFLRFFPFMLCRSGLEVTAESTGN